MAGEAYKAAGALFLSHLVKDQVGTFVVINFVVSIYALSAVLTKVTPPSLLCPFTPCMPDDTRNTV